MTWTYSQSTGQLKHDGNPVSVGYSGFVDGKNNPEKEDVPGIGPLPKGGYHIGKAHTSDTHGPIVMSLTPLSCTNTFGRSGFLIHGDSILKPGFASHGCIILPRNIRDAIACSGDTTLEVVE